MKNILLPVDRLIIFNTRQIRKNYWQAHKMDYMLFASVIKSIFFQKSFIISSINKENRFNINLVFRTWDQPQGVPLTLDGKIVVFNKIKNRKKLWNFWQILEIGSTVLGVILGGLNETYLMTLWIKNLTWLNFLYYCFFFFIFIFFLFLFFFCGAL